MAARRTEEAPALPVLRSPARRLGLTLPGYRALAGMVTAVLLPGLLSWAMTQAGTVIGAAGHALLFLLCVVLTALIGGLLPAVLCALLCLGLLNYYFIEPVHTLRISEPHDLSALVVFLVSAILVGGVVHRAAALSARATRSAAEANTLAAVARGISGGEEALPSLLDELRTAFAMTSVALLDNSEPAGVWRSVACSGEQPATHPGDADVCVPAGAGLTLALIGRPLAPDDRQVLEAFAAQAAGLLKRDELAAEAARAVELAAADRLRNALLAAVGHDLRSPLASASAAVSSLRASDVEWSAQERDDLLATAERSLQRLASLVTDLLDLSRLQAGVLRPATEQVWVEDLIGPALDELGEAANPVRITVPDDLAPACGDAALVLRTLVNLVANAIRHSPPGRPPSVTGEVCAASVRVCVIDHGVGVPAADRDRIFRPFQRLGDTDNSTGLGLGLALSRGFVEAMQGTLEAVDTPGGGLTTIVSLPIWQEEP